MPDGLAIAERAVVLSSSAESVLGLIRNQKCRSRITDSSILVSETKKI